MLKIEKKYTIHILSIRAIKRETFDLPQEQNAIIVCTDRTNPFVYTCKPENILILNFPDVEDDKYSGAFNSAHAKKIVQFVKSLSEQVTDIYVCCSKGGSRSPAVAAALLRMSGRSDRDVWLNPYYVPNTLVYLRLCQEYVLAVSKFSVRLRQLINEWAFHRAKKGKPCKYERWQILD